MNDHRGTDESPPARNADSDCPEGPQALPVLGELRMMIEDFLGIILRMSQAQTSAVRILSADERNLQLIGALGTSKDACKQSVERQCGICGDSFSANEVRSTESSACMGRQGCQVSGARSVVALPLEYQGSRIGVCSLFFAEEKQLTPEMAQFFRHYGELLGIALENFRQSRENRRTSLLAERQAMANEIHDSLAQTLVFARMRMSLLADSGVRDETLSRACISEVDEALAEGQKSIRELITHFRSQMDPEGLQHALQELAEGFRARSGIALDYCNKVAEIDLPLDHELQVFHIVRELLSNISTHSGATHALLLVERKEQCYVFTVSDNGSGFLTSMPKQERYGLKIICERATALNGEIDIDSAEGVGTRVRLSFPAPDLA